jgi:hypothetical protein
MARLLSGLTDIRTDTCYNPVVAVFRATTRKDKGPVTKVTIASIYCSRVSGDSQCIQ